MDIYIYIHVIILYVQFTGVYIYACVYICISMYVCKYLCIYQYIRLYLYVCTYVQPGAAVNYGLLVPLFVMRVVWWGEATLAPINNVGATSRFRVIVSESSSLF